MHTPRLAFRHRPPLWRKEVVNQWLEFVNHVVGRKSGSTSHQQAEFKRDHDDDYDDDEDDDEEEED